MYLSFQGKHAEAGPLHERSQAIWEKALGPGHPDVANVLNNRAELLRIQVRDMRQVSQQIWPSWGALWMSCGTAERMSFYVQIRATRISGTSLGATLRLSC